MFLPFLCLLLDNVNYQGKTFNQYVKSLIYKIFKTFYVQRYCGYSDDAKATQIINVLQKVPTVITLVLSEDSKLEKDSGFSKKQAQKIQRVVTMCSNVKEVKQINLYCPFFANSRHRLVIQNCLKSNQSSEADPKINIVGQQIHEQLKKLQKNSSLTPLVILMTKYGSVNHLPVEYLVNAELAFLPSFLSTSNYDIVKGFQQYSNSRQRNGK